MDKKSVNQTAKWRRPGSKPKKRKFHGVLPHDHEANTSYASASASKLQQSEDTSFDVHVDQTSGYSIIQFFLVFSTLQEYLKCKTCDKDISFTKSSIPDISSTAHTHLFFWTSLLPHFYV
ncbi:hypothetical protein KQX54_010493 [Cotesia glomerata]|uniref:Uncharacterized protein n=1 Tax=Cotesia glomerata TaxID=32391 RepID=A0AAV7HU48_COTGL|nr:hypothetical protein KQX54_010493 [Cotesia glomerata]